MKIKIEVQEQFIIVGKKGADTFNIRLPLLITLHISLLQSPQTVFYRRPGPTSDAEEHYR
jgi:hypothetical protein